MRVVVPVTLQARAELVPTEPRPVRLRFHLEVEGGVWNYHLPPGPDPDRDAGRNHVLLDPEAPFRAYGPGFVRPIELWRARQWHRRASAAVVRYTLDDEVAQGGGDVINVGSVVEFLGDISAYRLGALGLLVDAVALALDGGPQVVLAAPSPDEGAMWIGAVSFLSAPATCLALSFSTHERLADLLTGDRRRPLLSVVPYQDADLLRRGQELSVTVVDPRVEARLGATNGVEHRENHLGQLVPLTDWSRLALDVCCEAPAALQLCLRRLDEVCLSISWQDDTGGSMPPSWPLAAAVAVSGGFPLALPSATRVILRDTPEGVQLEGELAERVTGLMSATVNDAGEAWDRLIHAVRQPVGGSTLAQAAFESYVVVALQDDGWLMRGVPPLPDMVPTDPWMAGRLRVPVAEAVMRMAQGPAIRITAVQRGVVLLRAIDFLDRLEDLVGDLRLTEAGLVRLAAEATYLLSGPAGAAMAELAGPLSGAALRQWVIPSFGATQRDWSGTPGERLPPPVIALLANACDVDGILRLLDSEALAADPLLVEIAVASACGRVVGDPRLRVPAVEFMLREYWLRDAPGDPEADHGDAIVRIFARVDGPHPWTATDLLRVVDRTEPALGPYLVPVALGRVEEWSRDQDAGRLAGALLKAVQLLPVRAPDGSRMPRRAGVRESDVHVLNILFATGTGWVSRDAGLNRRAGEILMWTDLAWTGADESTRRVIASRAFVAAFQVALACEAPSEVDGGAAARLAGRLPVVPLGRAWRAAVPLGLDDGIPYMIELLTQDGYRLAGELVRAATRALIGRGPARDDSDVPRLIDLPVSPVVRALVAGDQSGRVLHHLMALVEAELRRYEPGEDATRRLVAFWGRALPRTDVADLAAAVAGRAAMTPARETVDERVLFRIRLPSRPRRGWWRRRLRVFRRRARRPDRYGGPARA